MKSVDKCKKVLEQALSKGKSAVVDNTNRSKDVRRNYVEIAKRLGRLCTRF